MRRSSTGVLLADTASPHSPPGRVLLSYAILSRILRCNLHQLRRTASRPLASRCLRRPSEPRLSPLNPPSSRGFRTVSLPFLRGLSSRTASVSAADAPDTSSSSPSPPCDEHSTRIPALDSSVLDPSTLPKLPFRFDTGVALYAKRAPRPFPPPFHSPPSGSFSDPLSTHHHGRGSDRRATFVDGQLIQGATNGDDAVFASEYFICANDGVGAWSTRPRGHAGLWARLILHFWAAATFESAKSHDAAHYTPDPIAYLQRAYEQTIAATSAPNDWQGTTTATGAQLHFQPDADSGEPTPVLYVTNLGDSQVMVVRPSDHSIVFKSEEQWHWFDCPRQLGTNSPDTPTENAVMSVVKVQEGDIVLAMSDGVIDNLWAHEIAETVSGGVERWQSDTAKRKGHIDNGDRGMIFVAHELMEAAKIIALDPFAESPFMERAIEEGLASGGGKLDDISVVAARVQKNE